MKESIPICRLYCQLCVPTTKRGQLTLNMVFGPLSPPGATGLFTILIAFDRLASAKSYSGGLDEVCGRLLASLELSIGDYRLLS